VLEVREASKTFNRGTSNEINALMDINLTLRNAGFLVVVGTNGSGKSTLLNAIAGTFLLDAGWIDLDGRDISREPEHRRAALMGRVFQNPLQHGAGYDRCRKPDIIAHAGLPQTLAGPAGPCPHILRDRIHGLNMGLEDRLDQPRGTLSGGQRQALTLLMATCVGPACCCWMNTRRLWIPGPLKR
jgi:putative ABC transport system ATP-binding protein